MADIERIGLGIGLRDLTVAAVATELGVSPAALYRHVGGKFGLETLVGERILSELRLVDNPTHDVAEHLVATAEQFRGFLLANPGLSSYVQVLFPRGPAGEALIAGQISSLINRGCSAEAAMMACTTVALIVMSVAAAEENRRDRSRQVAEIERRRQEALGVYAKHGLADTEMDADAYFSYVIRSCLNGILHTTGIQSGDDTSSAATGYDSSTASTN
ncbi:TetR/AcrR family transcriptional regulator [Mycobacterium vicinigordonae]|uniref:TetR family transcriptional regulator n=1 Tax=Mycobacterium vicinigordonae TaxID=1719132 RepID=A0A7D6DWP2_9MYCO|nr:TetR/AcrR family transcriptional regulator [Mycobacterium vicinigordonae]QLL06647.1 TetR family transcriptional regulator [Mycobacterium vicinigordonae]